MADKNLMYRKTILKTIYRSSKVYDEIMDYEDYKKSILENKKSNYKYYYYLYGLYKCHQFILNSQIEKYNPLIINVLYNLLFNKNMSKTNQINLLKVKIDFDNIEETIVNLIKIVNLKSKKDKYVFSYIMLVYMLYLKEQVLYNLSNLFF